jgi:DNA-damage-inducible protein J
MAKGNMTLRVEPELKAQAASLFQSTGIGFEYGNGNFYRQALGAMDFLLKSR